ncbi:glycosyltransferase [Limnobacter humi]|uniref:Glycosyltransferase n=1 Tax=Limnobacter humi TaxID=1778671 RepID=A0ABT1WKW2_9BURK|nr:glycosyltransferase [Limnobacter humi]MCQ8897803.1 glycosyltransferase [Limnobacter humi]
MRILTIATRVPQLDAKGDQLVAHHRLMALIRSEHQVDLICCLVSPPSPADELALHHLHSAGIRCQIIVIPRLAQVRNLFSGLFVSTIPLQAALFRSQACRKLIETHIRDFDPDLLYLVLFRPYVNVNGIDKPLVVDFIDSVSLNYERMTKKNSLLLRPIFNFETKRSRRYEQELARRAAFSFVVADDDARNIAPDYVRVLHNGVDTSKFSGKRDALEIGRIIFSGNMNYGPNAEAVIWFCEKCWPEINRRYPMTKFVICGANPSTAVQSLVAAYPNVTVTGRVESVAAELNKSCISIAPMQSGAGMQNKILEAMSCGLPVVTTTLGRGSIAAEPGFDIMIADDPADFTESILTLLEDSSLRDSLGSRARSYVSRKHDWKAIGQSFVTSIETLSRK